MTVYVMTVYVSCLCDNFRQGEKVIWTPLAYYDDIQVNLTCMYKCIVVGSSCGASI